MFWHLLLFFIKLEKHLKINISSGIRIYRLGYNFSIKNEILKLKIGEDIPENEKKLLINKFHLSSHIICICLDRSDESIIPEWEEIAALAMSVQNMWLTCSANNIGCYWSSPKIISELNMFLKLKENQKCLGLFYIGKYDDLPKRNLQKIDINQKTEWI